MVTREAYRDGMARLTGAVNVITTDGPAGRGGFTASAVCSVTDDPPTLLVCVNLASRQAELMRRNGVVCVNVLAWDQMEIAALFATRDLSIEQRYAMGAWQALKTGAPALQDALAAFDCRIVERLERGTHGVLFCEVQAVRTAEAREALIYYGRGYRTTG